MAAIIDKIIHFKPEKKTEKSIRKTAVRGLAGFFALMLVFTVLSRVADAMTIAEVSAVKPEKRSINKTITQEGLIEKNREQAVSTIGDLKIKSVNVSQGSSVQEGDVLMELDMDALAEKILQLETDIKKDTLTREANAENASKADSERSRQISKAKASYDRAVSQGNRAVMKAYEDMEGAYNKLVEFQNSSPGDGGSGTQVESTLIFTIEQKQEAILRAEEVYEDLEEEIEDKIAEEQDKEQEKSETTLTNAQLKAIEKEVTESYKTKLSDAEKAIETAKKELEDAENALSAYQAEKAQENDNDTAAQEAELLADYKSKADAYDSAVDAMQESVASGSDAISDASVPADTDNSDEIAEMEQELKQIELDKLLEIQKDNGLIYSPVTGTVTEVAATTGDFTPSTKCFLLADTSEGLRFTAQIDKDQKKYISKQDTVKLTLSDDTVLENLTIDTIVQNAENADLTDVTIRLEDGDNITIGETAVMEVTRNSQAYNIVIPLEAIYEDQGTKYVLILNETQSTLGTEMEVERIDVVIQEKNESYAAIDEVITSDQRVVTDSSKDVETGDRVRLAGE